MKHPGLHRFLSCAPFLCDIANWRRYRRWQGGHWERWYIETVWDDLWLDFLACTRETGGRPPLGRGTPTCEDYR